jgi:NADPH2:quinone reductase
MRGVAILRPGEPEELQPLELPERHPGPGQALVELSAAGVNFMDMGVRRGQFWKEMPYPKVLGVEGAGRVVAIGDGVDAVHVGQRVAWAYAPGSYAERVLVPATALVPLPDGIDYQTAAAIMMQGLTASHFATDFYPVQRGDFALVHAAAGGVGFLLTQIIKLRGGRVIARVSHEDKVPVVRDAGGDHVIVDADGTFAEEVIRASGGQGVHVVYDGSGPRTFQASLASLRRGGTFCWYGPVLGSDPVDLMSLPRSIKIGYATFFDHVPTCEALRARAARLFDWVAQGALKVRIHARYPLAEAARAHAEMEARGTTGKLLLVRG